MSDKEMEAIETVFLNDEEDISVAEMEERAQKEADGLEDANISA